MSAQFFSQPIAQITVEQLASRLAESRQGVQLLDVREPEEVAIARLDGFEVLPLSQFSEWSGQIESRFDKDTETIVMCHHGMRSAQMCQWLMDRGFTNVKNLAGGIDLYSAVVDPQIPRY